MSDLTETDVGAVNEGFQHKIVTASVTAADDTITIGSMTTIKDVRAVIAGTPATLKACTFSGNVITTTGWSSGTESWLLHVYGV